MNSEESLLIITSTIFVKSHLTKIVDPKERESQYVNSILFYLHESNFKRIVICDNSNFDYSKYNFHLIAKKERKEIEILSFLGNDSEVVKYGKGFGEGEIMKYINENSRFFENTNSYFKVTGRIIVKNINKIIQEINPRKNYFDEIKKNIFFSTNKLDTRLYFCQKTTYQNFLSNAYLQVNDFDGYYLEHAYYNAFKGSETVFEYFKIYPIFIGLSGSLGTKYNESRIKIFLKQMLRCLMNFFVIL